MSTRYGYHCVTCDVSSHAWLNHGDVFLRNLLLNRRAVVEAYNFSQQDGYLEMSVMGAMDDPQPLEWLAEHVDHTLVLEDEYGRRSEADSTGRDLIV